MRSGALALASLAALGCGDPAGGASPAAPSTPALSAEVPAWACPFGPVLGGAVIQPQVDSGRYELEASYSQDSLPTMERQYINAVHGRAAATLGEDGTFEICLGEAETQRASVSRYASEDKQDHTSLTQHATLMHLRGRWTQASDGARLTVTAMGYDECTAPAEQMSPYGPVSLVCGSLPASAQNPVPALACRAMGQLHGLETLGLDLGTSRRAGPWQLRTQPMERGPADAEPPCGPWLLLGASPGLTVRSEEGPRDEAPKLSWISGVQPMELEEFQLAR